MWVSGDRDRSVLCTFPETHINRGRHLFHLLMLFFFNVFRQFESFLFGIEFLCFFVSSLCSYRAQLNSLYHILLQVERPTPTGHKK